MFSKDFIDRRTTDRNNNFSKFFIDRPIFALVLSILIVVAGLLSLKILPVTQYPSIIPPEVNISAYYPGASAETIANTVATSLEGQINGVPNMIYMNSTSSNTGSYDLTVTFSVGTDPDQAAIDVNDRIQAAISRLPNKVIQQGVTVKKKSSSILEILTVYSPDNRYSAFNLSNYASINIIDELRRLPGVGGATIFGAEDYAMRIWLKPDKLAQYGLIPDDVEAAIKDQNAQYTIGAFGQNPVKNQVSFSYNISTQGQLITAEQFGNIILKSTPNSGVICVKDVARIELGAVNYQSFSSLNGKPTIAIGIYLLPGANALKATQAVEEKIQELSKKFPSGIAISSPFNTAKFVELSIDEVTSTFIKSILLAIAVIYLFLQNIRATLILIITIPISLIGTFAGMNALGFSINLLTLFGMVLAIGIVVDDAIVVLENFERIMRTQQLTAREAAIKAMNEVSGPIVAIVLILCAVFIPVAFIGGLTGEMYKQFSVTIAISTIISGFVALTLTPALSAIILEKHQPQTSTFFHKFNTWFENKTRQFVQGAHYLINRMALSCIVFAGFIVTTVILLLNIPSTLVPNEDQGYAFVLTKMQPSASLGRTQKISDHMTKYLVGLPQTQDVITLTGFDLLSGSAKSNASTSFVIFKDWQQRQGAGEDVTSLVKKIIGFSNIFKDATTTAFSPPPITGISRTGGSEGYLQSRNNATTVELFKQAAKLSTLVKTNNIIGNINVIADADVPQYYVHLDRQKVKAMQVSIDTIYSTLGKVLSDYYVNDFTLYGRAFNVLISGDSEYREKPEDLRHIFVRADDGSMVPISSLITTERFVGPDTIERYNMFSSIRIIATPKGNHSNNEVVAEVERLVAENLSQGFTVAWSGSAYQEKTSQSSANFAFMIGIAMVFLILAAQYESFSLPLSVVIAVPFAIFGAALSVWLRGLNNDIYFQVGLLTLIGLSAKNAVLMVEFAVLQMKQGAGFIEAALQAARLRLRPIIMTSVAFILGCMPLAISSGAGAASRHTIGTSVVGGMLAATLIAIFFIPVFFCIIVRMSQKLKELKLPKL